MYNQVGGFSQHMSHVGFALVVGLVPCYSAELAYRHRVQETASTV
jgi:hypothetical protein